MRLNFVDNVRGQTVPFSKDVVTEKLVAEVTAVTDERIEFEISGSTLAEHAGFEAPRNQEGRWPRGVRTEILGTAVAIRAVPDELQIVELTLVAVGQRWGRTRYNGRSRDLRPSPVGYSLTIAPKTPAGRVAPAYIFRYRGEWRR